MRIIIVVTSLIGAILFSQFPAYGQQYLQRLGGAVDELAIVVDDFDSDAARAGKNRDDALEEMRQADGFVGDRGLSMTRTVARYERLSVKLAELETRSSVLRGLVPAFAPDRGRFRLGAE